MVMTYNNPTSSLHPQKKHAYVQQWLPIPGSHAMPPFMPTDTFCSDTFYVHTDPDSLPSFAEECSFGNWSSDSYH